MLRSVRPLLLAAAVVALTAPAARAHGCHHRDSYAQALLERWPSLAEKYPGLQGHDHSSGTQALSLGNGCLPGDLDLPARWFSGDTHSHVQWCGSGATGLVVGADYVVDFQMVPGNLSVSSPLVWGAYYDTALGKPGQIDENRYDAIAFDPVEGVTGQEHSFTVPLNDRTIQVGVEVSGFSAQRWGHVSALNIDPSEADVYTLKSDFQGEVGCEPMQGPGHEEEFDFVKFTNAIDCGLPPPLDTGFKNDGTGDYPRPLLEYFRSNPDAATGYAHQFWPIDGEGLPTGYVDPVDGGWDWNDPAYMTLPTPIGPDLRCVEGPAGPNWPGNLNLAIPNNFETLNQVYPVLGGIDAMMGLVDYFEAWDMELTQLGDNGQEDTCIHDLSPMPGPPCGDTVPHGTPPSRWYGAYYKLLSSNKRLSFSAGSDAQCQTEGCVPSTYVKLQAGETLDYSTWVRNMKEGRVSIASGSYQFLDLRVNGQDVGSQVEVDSPATDVVVDMFFWVDEEAIPDLDVAPERRTVELLIDGEVVHTAVVPTQLLINLGGKVSLTLTSAQVPELALAESSWIAGRLKNDSAHTGIVYAIVDGEPIVDCMSAEYWMLYCDYVNVKIDAYAWCADSSRPGSPGAPEFLEEHVGCSEAEIREYLAEARRMFQAVRDYDSPLPTGVTRVGRTTPSAGVRPLGVGTPDTAVPGAPFRLTCFDAPPDSAGLVLAGASSLGHLLLQPPLPGITNPLLCGAELLVLSSPGLWFPVTSNSGGYAEWEIPIPSLIGAGDQLYFQFLWLAPGACQAPGDTIASPALSVTVQ